MWSRTDEKKTEKAVQEEKEGEEIMGMKKAILQYTAFLNSLG